METLEEEMTLAQGASGKDSTVFHHASQNCAQFETYTRFISGIFHLVLSDHWGSQVTEILQSENIDKENYNLLSFGSGYSWLPEEFSM